MLPVASTLGKRPGGPLEVGTPFYQDGLLQVRVYWKNRGGMCSWPGLHSTVITTPGTIHHPASFYPLINAGLWI